MALVIGYVSLLWLATMELSWAGMQGEGRGTKGKWLCNTLKYGFGWRGESGGRDLSLLFKVFCIRFGAFGDGGHPNSSQDPNGIAFR